MKKPLIHWAEPVDAKAAGEACYEIRSVDGVPEELKNSAYIISYAMRHACQYSGMSREQWMDIANISEVNGQYIQFPIKISGFWLNDKGDPSVGIQPSSWEITGGFEFEHLGELEMFKQKLREAYEYVSDTIEIHTFEEIKAREAAMTE